VEILLGGGVLPHFAVHGGSQQDTCLWVERQGHAGQGIIGQSVRHFCHDIGGGGCDEEQGGFVCQTDVGGFPSLLLVVEIRDNGMTGQCLEGQWSDKTLGVGGEDHAHIRTGLHQATGEIDRLVGGDGARDSENDEFFVGHGGEIRGSG
jgi:hypothetical protein